MTKESRIIIGDCRSELAKLPDESVHCVVTSPPYIWLRDYGVEGQIGLEVTIEEFLDTLVKVFREVRRVLRHDGTLWLNMGDTYASGGRGGGGSFMEERRDASWKGKSELNGWRGAPDGYHRKDMLCMPWELAIALRRDGWVLRQDIIWEKPNCMPESAWDRPTKSHEYVFMFAKSDRYFYDPDAIREPVTGGARTRGGGVGGKTVPPGRGQQVRIRNNESFGRHVRELVEQRNKRSVWRIPTEPYKGDHKATFPRALVLPCLLAGTSAAGCCKTCGAPRKRNVVVDGPSFRDLTKGRDRSEYSKATLRGSPHSFAVRGSHVHIHRVRKTVGWEPTCECAAPTVPCVVLDPFGGSGTVGCVAAVHGRDYILIELNPDSAEEARLRIRSERRRAGLLRATDTAPAAAKAEQLGLLPTAGEYAE